MTSKTSGKLRLQLELKLQKKLMDDLKKQGWFVTKTSDRFKAGRPDLRVAHDLHGQLDVELKYSLEDFTDEEQPTGLSKLQWLKMKEMNENGMPTIGLVYCEPSEVFFITTVLRDNLPQTSRCIKKLSVPGVISGPELFVKTMEHLNDLGYHRKTRDWRKVR